MLSGDLSLDFPLNVKNWWNKDLLLMILIKEQNDNIIADTKTRKYCSEKIPNICVIWMIEYNINQRVMYLCLPLIDVYSLMILSLNVFLSESVTWLVSWWWPCLENLISLKDLVRSLNVSRLSTPRHAPASQGINYQGIRFWIDHKQQHLLLFS